MSAPRKPAAPKPLTAKDRLRALAACRFAPHIAERALTWLGQATCEQDRNVRILCLETVPSHFQAENVLVAAKKSYHFAVHPPDNPDLFESGPGAPPGRRAASRRAQTA